MKKLFLTLFLTLLSTPLIAQPINMAPQISYAQKTKIIVELKKQTNTLGGQIEQNGKDIHLELYIRHNLSESDAKAEGRRFISLVKSNSSDDPVESPMKPSTGRFNYSITIRNPLGKILFSGLKPAKNSTIIWADDALETKENTSENLKEKDTPENNKELPPKPISLQEKIKANPSIDPLDIADFPEKYH